MSISAWQRIVTAACGQLDTPWLPALLTRNADTAYLRRYGSPQTIESFRERLPLVRYEDLAPWLARIENGEGDVLFAGHPIAWERTGGSTGGPKLLPYSAAGLEDIRRAVVPWFASTVRRHEITGKAYFALSPATRPHETRNGVPVGLHDSAYFGAEVGNELLQVSAVPAEVTAIIDVDRWRDTTLTHLRAAHDLELVSVWSPTFLLDLLEDLDDPRVMWPALKVVSCWASAGSKHFAGELAARVPHAHLQPKGLLSTECVVTIPDHNDRPVLSSHGFFEFERNGITYLAAELERNFSYEVVATTASGLYRYRTGDTVRCEGFDECDRPVLEFQGRGALVSDLVGEKLYEPFVTSCLDGVPGFRFVAPDDRGYVLVTEADCVVDLAEVEVRLCRNPQYAYARRIGQLKPLRQIGVSGLFERYASRQMARGTRLGDVKPTTLWKDRSWRETLTSQ
jgi:hypothetical protein